MAIVAVYTHENCPGMPKGATVRIHDDCLAEDQEAAWAHAREVHARIYFNQQRRKLAQQKEQQACSGQD